MSVDKLLNVEIRRNTELVSRFTEWWLAIDAASSLSELLPRDRIDVHDTVTGSRRVYRKGEKVFPID